MGDSFTNLLGMCDVDPESDNRRIVKRYDKVHYVPLNKRHVPTIEVHIKNIADNFAHLLGLTYVKLHFREKK